MYLDILSHKPDSHRQLIRRIWSGSFLNRWKRHKATLLGLSALIVVASGMVGFALLRQPPSLLDSLYQSLQFFALDGSDNPQTNAYLQVARFLAPTVVGYAAVGAVVAMYREQVNRFWIGRLRHHVVIVGLGNAGFRLAKAFDSEGWPVVVIEKDPTHPAIEGCRQRGIHVLSGDATDPDLLRRVGVDDAVLLVAMCGDDRTNMDVAAAARSVSAENPSEFLTGLVEFDDFELWYVMKAQALVDRDLSAFRLELFNLWALGAELLLDAHPPFSQEAPGSPHVLVSSDEGLAYSLVVGILRRWMVARRHPGDHLWVTLSCKSPEAVAELASRNPELTDVDGCHIEQWDPGGASGDGNRGSPDDASAIYVAFAEETTALTTAINLRHRIGRWEDAPIVIAVEDEDAGVAHAVGRGGPTLKGISAFGWLSHALRPETLLERTATEQIARLGHQLHCEHQAQLGLTERDDASLVPWERLPQNLRESNRLWADGISAKLAEIRCIVVPAPLIDPTDVGFEFRDEEVARLAPLEHDRWSADMKRMGYQAGPRDGRHHPLIDVPYELLAEENKEKDRAHVLTMPEVLARAGMRIVRLPEPVSVER